MNPIKLAWGIAGFASLGLGVLGLILPGLPSTVFLLVTAYCFARCSDRLHSWLMDHPHLGPPIRDWREHGAISMRNKITAAVMMVLTIVVSLLFGAPYWVIILQAVCLTGVSIFIWTRPSGPGSEVTEETDPSSSQ